MAFSCILVAYLGNALFAEFTTTYFLLNSIGIFFFSIGMYGGAWWHKVILLSCFYNVMDEVFKNACTFTIYEAIGFIIILIYYFWKR